MTRLAAKGLLKAGIAMVILTILCRFIASTPSGLMGDNLALIASALLALVAALYLRFAPAEHQKSPETPRTKK